MRKTLLLNSSYETLNFISLRKLIKLVVKDRVEILSNWNGDPIIWAEGGMEYPATVRMKEYVRRGLIKTRFNRRGIFRRDMFTCQYCKVVLATSKLTIDHVVPRQAGGKSSWENCVACCLPCNAKKGNRTPAQAKMELLCIPKAPRKTLDNEYILTTPKHDDWKIYFPLVEHINPISHIDHNDI